MKALRIALMCSLLLPIGWAAAAERTPAEHADRSTIVFFVR